MFNRIPGIIRFNASTYRAVITDAVAIPQAAGIVVLVSLIQGLASKLATTPLNQAGFNWSQELVSLLLTVALGLIVWMVIAGLLALIAKIFGGKTGLGEMLRLAGYVQIFGLLSLLTWLAPASVLLNVLIAIAILALGLAGYAVGLWETANLSKEKALVVAVLATLTSLAVIFLIDQASGAVVPGLLWLIG